MHSGLVLVFALVGWFALCSFTTHRLRRLHPELWEQLGRPSPAFHTLQQGWNFVVDFLFARDPGIADDELLSGLRVVMQLYLLGVLLIMFLR